MERYIEAARLINGESRCGRTEEINGIKYFLRQSRQDITDSEIRSAIEVIENLQKENQRYHDYTYKIIINPEQTWQQRKK